MVSHTIYEDYGKIVIKNKYITSIIFKQNIEKRLLELL